MSFVTILATGCPVGTLPGSLAIIPTGIVVLAAAAVVLLAVLLSCYRRVGPQEVLIISGRKHRLADGTQIGFRVVRAGGAFVWPIFERAEVLPLARLPVEVQTSETPTRESLPVKVTGAALVKVQEDDAGIRTAAELFLGKGPEEIKGAAKATLEGSLRLALGTLSAAEVYHHQTAVETRVREFAGRELAKLGMEIVSFKLRALQESQGYVEAVAQSHVAELKRDAQIAQVEAERESLVRSAQAHLRSQEATLAVQAKLAQAQHDYELQAADSQAKVEQKRAEADLAYDLQKNKIGQLVKAEEVQAAMAANLKQAGVPQPAAMPPVKARPAS